MPDRLWWMLIIRGHEAELLMLGILLMAAGLVGCGYHTAKLIRHLWPGKDDDK